MNCTDFKIWLRSADEEDVFSPVAEALHHSGTCEECTSELVSLQKAYRLIDSQKKSNLSEEKSNRMLEVLLNSSASKKPLMPIWIGRAAAILVVALGILSGIALSNFLGDSSESQADIWGEEFSLLSDNSNFSLFE